MEIWYHISASNIVRTKNIKFLNKKFIGLLILDHYMR
jgi:hypothetical protein